MATVGQLLILIAGNNAPLTAAIASSEAQMRGFSASTATHGAAAGGALLGVGIAAVAMGAATAVATAASINAAASFQDQLAIINTIAHQTPEELNRTGAAIRAMAVASGEPLDNLTSAFYDLLSAGVPASQAMAVLGQSTTLAIGGLATTKQTVDLLTTAMNAYGLDAGGVATATDQFALAIEHGKVKADQIAASFADIAPLAKTAGIGIDEIAAAYAVLTARGVPAADVTTQMNRAIIELLKPNADLVALQKETGLNFAKIASEQGLVVALQAMREAAANAGVPFQDLFGRLEGMKFALATTGPEFKKYQDEMAAMGLATGTAAAQAEERMGTFNRQTAILGQSIGDLAIEVGTGFLPAVTALVQQISGAVQGVAAWARENPGLANTLLAVVGGISALVAGVVFLGPIIGALATVFGILTSPITLVVGAVAALAASFGLLGEGPKAFVDGLAASFDALLPATGPIRDAVNLIGQALDALPGIVSTAQSAIGGFVATLQSAWASIGPDVIAAVSAAFDTLSGAIGTVAGVIGPLIGQVVSFVTSAGFMRAVAEGVGTAFSIIRGAIDGVIAVISTIVGWFLTFVQHLTGARNAGSAARSVFDGLASILGIIGTVLGTIVSVIATVVTAFITVGNRTGFFKLILDGLKLAGDAINLVFAALGTVLNLLFTVIGTVAGAISGALTIAFNAIKGVIDGVKGAVNALIDALKAAIDFAGRAVAAVSKVPTAKSSDAEKAAFSVGAGFNPISGLAKMFGFDSFASGGVVPGPQGAPTMAVVHGGETITPAGGQGGSVNVIHTHVHLDGREIAEVVERVVFDNASTYSSGFVGSPVTS